MLRKLRTKMVEIHVSQIRASKVVNIEPTRLSRIIQEHIEPRADERARLIATFGAAALRPTTPRVAQALSEVEDGMSK